MVFGMGDDDTERDAAHHLNLTRRHLGGGIASVGYGHDGAWPSIAESPESETAGYSM